MASSSGHIGFTCEICQPPRSYAYKCTLKDHYKSVHKKIPASFAALKEVPPKKKPCEFCGKEFSLLKQHQETCQAAKESRAQRPPQPLLPPPPSAAEDRRQRYEQNKSVPPTPEKPVKSSDIIPFIAASLAQNKGLSRETIVCYTDPLYELMAFAGRKRKTIADLKVAIQEHYCQFIATRATVKARLNAWAGVDYGAGYLHMSLHQPRVHAFIKAYLSSVKRLELFTSLTAKDGSLSAEDKRKFLLAETLLATRSEEFVRKLTVKNFRENHERTSRGGWKFMAGTSDEVTCEMPDSLRRNIFMYVATTRRGLLGEARASKPHSRVFGDGSHPKLVVTINNSIWKWAEEISRAHCYFGCVITPINNLSKLDYDYSEPCNGKQDFNAWDTCEQEAKAAMQK